MVDVLVALLVHLDRAQADVGVAGEPEALARFVIANEFSLRRWCHLYCEGDVEVLMPKLKSRPRTWAPMPDQRPASRESRNECANSKRRWRIRKTIIQQERMLLVLLAVKPKACSWLSFGIRPFGEHRRDNVSPCPSFGTQFREEWPSSRYSCEHDGHSARSSFI